MNWTGVANYIGSAAGLAITAFLSTFLATSMPMNQRLHVAGAAAVTALIQHWRENPFKS